MADADISSTPQVRSDALSPSDEAVPMSLQPEPGTVNKVIRVPQDIVNAGHSVNDVETDSPESLDQEITQGADRERIDPHHTIMRPDVDTIDKEENGL